MQYTASVFIGPFEDLDVTVEIGTYHNDVVIERVLEVYDNDLEQKWDETEIGVLEDELIEFIQTHYFDDIVKGFHDYIEAFRYG